MIMNKEKGKEGRKEGRRERGREEAGSTAELQMRHRATWNLRNNSFPHRRKRKKLLTRTGALEESPFLLFLLETPLSKYERKKGGEGEIIPRA